MIVLNAPECSASTKHPVFSAAERDWHLPYCFSAHAVVLSTYANNPQQVQSVSTCSGGIVNGYSGNCRKSQRRKQTNHGMSHVHQEILTHMLKLNFALIIFKLKRNNTVLLNFNQNKKFLTFDFIEDIIYHSNIQRTFKASQICKKKDFPLIKWCFFGEPASNYTSSLTDWSQNKSPPPSQALLFLCLLISYLDERLKQQPDPSAAGLHRFWGLLRPNVKAENMEAAFSVTMGTRQVRLQAVH